MFVPSIAKTTITMAFVTATWVTPSYSDIYDFALVWNNPATEEIDTQCSVVPSLVRISLRVDKQKSALVATRRTQVTLEAFGRGPGEWKEHVISLKNGQLRGSRGAAPIPVQRLWQNPVVGIYKATGGFAFDNHGYEVDVNNLSRIVRWGHNSRHFDNALNQLIIWFRPEMVVDPEYLQIADGKTYEAEFIVTCVAQD